MNILEELYKYDFCNWQIENIYFDAQDLAKSFNVLCQRIITLDEPNNEKPTPKMSDKTILLWWNSDTTQIQK